MDSIRLTAVISGLLVLALAGYSFTMYTVSGTHQSTFNLQPGLTYDLAKTANAQDSVSGHFQETSGNPVSFYILTSAQFAAFENGVSLDYVYGLVNLPSSNISYTFPSHDTYYLIFNHGQNLSGSTETVDFRRTYTVHNSYPLALGLILLPIAAVDFVYGFRRRKPRSVEASTEERATAKVGSALRER